MERLKSMMQKHKQISCTLLLGYIAFNGCFMFPFSNELFPFTFQDGYLIIHGYGMIGLLFAGLLDKNKPFAVLLLSFLFTVIGLILRYLLELGEISNEMNFTFFNITLYILIIPIYCLVVYLFARKG